MVKIRDFHHVGVVVTDVEKSKQFYEKVLGLKQLPGPNIKFNGAWFAVGDKAIHLLGAEDNGAPNRVGRHLAIDVEDFEATKAKLRKRGIEFEESTMRVAGRQLWVLDPDGNKVELRSEK